MTPATTRARYAAGWKPISSPLTRNGDTSRHRLVILGDEVSEVVCAAGGLIYDSSSGGWDVVAYLAESSNERPLQILGATTEPLASLGQCWTDALWPDGIIASPRVFAQNIYVRDYFTRALLRSHAATAMMGDDWPTSLGKDIGRVECRLSPAARAFKLQAMLAAEVVPTRDSAEILRCSAEILGPHRVSAAPTLLT